MFCAASGVNMIGGPASIEPCCGVVHERLELNEYERLN